MTLPQTRVSALDTHAHPNFLTIFTLIILDKMADYFIICTQGGGAAMVARGVTIDADAGVVRHVKITAVGPNLEGVERAHALDTNLIQNFKASVIGHRVIRTAVKLHKAAGHRLIFCDVEVKT